MQKRIGEFLVDRGILTAAQVHEILSYGHSAGLRFGEAALELGVLTREQLLEVFGPNYRVNFFHMDSKFFPKMTQDLFPLEMILRLGAVPLGYKLERSLFREKKLLNVGMLNPGRADAYEEIDQLVSKRLAPGGIRGIQTYLVLADQFVDVLKQVYGVPEEKLGELAQKAGQVDETLSMFLAA